jgi:hypothetical protein
MRAFRSLEAASVELLAGEPNAAAAELQAACDALERMGERGVRSTIAAFLAQALVAARRFDEAETFATLSEETAAAADVVAQAVWRAARARCRAEAGDTAVAGRLAREAVALAEGTDFLDLQASTLLDLAEVEGAAGRETDAPALVAAARDRYERKGNVVAAKRAAAVLAEAAR